MCFECESECLVEGNVSCMVIQSMMIEVLLIRVSFTFSVIWTF